MKYLLILLILISCTKERPLQNCGIVTDKGIQTGGNQVNPAGAHQMYLVVQFDRFNEIDTIPIGLIEFDKTQVGDKWCK